ncbi:transporter substrate-binding domain-containing protein [Clostridium scatologenes]|uniref:Cystine transporter subunit n=1 Tax=Clostridium scatologenes TaxID=1548 RepID=A0A0E3JLX4_CLOSL|nr:transporter substrate-binding domain-containing protein [Clostridium scatologenes]AKA67373.1 cystine transporter subunit [Clostridium scatologenes]
MIRNLKRVIGISLIFATIFSLFVGCGTKKEAQKQTTLLDKIKQSGKISVGLMGTYPPYNFLNKNNEIDGFDADIAKEIAKRIGVKAEFVSNDWSSMVGGLEKGKFDVVISQMTITDERKKTMDFSDPYIKNSVSAIVRQDNNSIKSIQDFKGKKIGVGLGTNDEKYLRDEVMPKVGNFQIVTYNDVITTLLDLNTGRIDATVNNMFAIKPEIDKNNIKVKAVGEALKNDYAGVAMKKNNPELLNSINKALKDMKSDGTYKQIFKKWFGVDPTL